MFPLVEQLEKRELLSASYFVTAKSPAADGQHDRSIDVDVEQFDTSKGTLLEAKVAVRLLVSQRFKIEGRDYVLDTSVEYRLTASSAAFSDVVITDVIDRQFTASGQTDATY